MRIKNKTTIQTYPLRILGSSIVVLSLCFLIMMFWFLLQPAIMSLILALEGEVSAQGNNAITLLKIAVNYWGVVGVVLILLTYGLMQAQKREWRGETF